MSIKNNNGEIKDFLLNFMVAGITATVSKTLTAPLERVKLILQNQKSVLQVLTGKRKSYNGIIDCFVRVTKEQGVRSLWRGNATNVIRYFPTQALNFAFNSFFINRLYGIIEKESFAITFISGSLSGGCSTAIAYPLEFCQTRISVDVGSDRKGKFQNKISFVEREFTGLRDCFRKICRAEGFFGLYKGFPIALFGTSIYRGLYFGLFDGVKRLWSANRQTSDTQEQVIKPPFFTALIMAQTVTVVSSTCSYPLDTVGRRLSMESGRPKELRMFNGLRQTVKHMYTHEGGIRAFYGGLGANCLRGLSGALVLVFYDVILDYLKQ